MDSNSEKLPREFGKYHLIERIATGGMAELYRAKLYGAGGFEKDLAIKKVLPQLASDNDFIQMFMDEAIITVTLSHGNIVSVIDFGELDHEYFLVMEFVDGVDLQSLINKSIGITTPFPPPIASYIALEVCRGLDYAHRKVGPDGKPLQIVHRDISPQNILISFEGEVKIVDFGIARAASRITSTQAGVVKGKLAYMAPEQISGQIADRRADVYSVGVFLYEMLTIRRPFEGSTPQETMAQITRGVFDKPHKLNKKVDKRLSAVVRKALEKNPKKRYQTAGEMAAELSSYLHRAGVYPDATTLAAFIPQRLPDARPRTIQPTPIRAIRRDAETAAKQAAAFPKPGTPSRAAQDEASQAKLQPDPTLASRGQEAVSFSMLDLPAYEPPDSNRPTDPVRPAVEEIPSGVKAKQALAAGQDDLLRAETTLLPKLADPGSAAKAQPSPDLLSAETRLLQAQPESEEQKSPGPPYDPELLAAKTQMLQAQDETTSAEPKEPKYDPALLAAETRMLQAQEEPATQQAEDVIADSWMEGESASPASTTGNLEAAAFPKRKPWLMVGVAIVAITLVVVVIWWVASRPAGDGDAADSDAKVEPSHAASGLATTDPAKPAEPDSPAKVAAIDAGQPDAGSISSTETEPSGVAMAAADAGTPVAAVVDAGTPVARKDAGAAPKVEKTAVVRAHPEKKKPPVVSNPVKKPVKIPAKKPVKKPPKKVAVSRPAAGKKGTLRINSEPFSVVFLGKRKIGPTPQMNVKLPVGSHTLTLKNEALGISKRIRVRIEANKIHTFFVDLNKK